MRDRMGSCDPALRQRRLFDIHRASVFVATLVWGLFILDPTPSVAQSTTESTAVAEARAQGSGDAVEAGWDGSFYLRSADGSFEFRPVGILHADLRVHENEYQINTSETLARTFDIRRLRLGFEGLLYRQTGYTFEVNVDDGHADLIYAYLNFQRFSQAQVRVGQFKEPFSYEVLYPEKYLDFVERSNISTSVAPAEDIGIMLHNLGRPYRSWLEYGVGVFNGEGSRLNDARNAAMEFAARTAIRPFVNGPGWTSKIAIAANLTYSAEQHRDVGFRPHTSEGFEVFPTLAVDGRRVRTGGDIQWFYGPYSAKAQYIRVVENRRSNQRDLITDGWHVDAMWLLTGQDRTLNVARGWELAVRAEALRVDAGEPFPVPDYIDEEGRAVLTQTARTRSFTLGLNRYVAPNIKVQLNYQHTAFTNPFLTPTSRVGEHVLRPSDSSPHKLLVRLQLFI